MDSDNSHPFCFDALRLFKRFDKLYGVDSHVEESRIFCAAQRFQVRVDKRDDFHAGLLLESVSNQLGDARRRQGSHGDQESGNTDGWMDCGLQVKWQQKALDLELANIIINRALGLALS